MSGAQDPKEAKKAYYERPDVVGRYERFRFGGASGRWIRETEERTVAGLLEAAAPPEGATGVDLPTGTGRMIPVLRQKLARVIACDISSTMLAEARKHRADEYLLADAAGLELPSASVDVILSHRFYPHYENLRPFLVEAARVLRPGGGLIFDAHNWSPRSLIPGAQRSLGGRVFNHPRELIEREAVGAGFMIAATRDIFAVTPFVYQFLPLAAVRVVEALGGRVARRKARTYYLLRRLPAPLPR